MFPLLFITVLLAIVSLSSAGPACTRKYYKTSQCIEKCQTRWGYPGTMMGTNPWGQVMQNVDDNTKDGWKAIVAEACGMDSFTSSSKGKATDDSKVTGSLDDDEEPIIEETSVDDDEEIVSKFKTNAAPSKFNTAAFAPKSSSTVSSSAPKKTNPPLPKAKGPEPEPEPAKPKTTTKKPIASTPNPPESADNTKQSGDIGEYLKAHNDVRRQHGAAPLTWSDKLASAAQKWANNCKFVHSGGAVGPFGENLAAGASSAGNKYSITSAINQWAAEVKDYNPNAPESSHFTQMVWKDSKQVGCALALCSGIFPANLGKASLYVCEYDPPGNFNNDFARNVQV